MALPLSEGLLPMAFEQHEFGSPVDLDPFGGCASNMLDCTLGDLQFDQAAWLNQEYAEFVPSTITDLSPAPTMSRLTSQQYPADENDVIGSGYAEPDLINASYVQVTATPLDQDRTIPNAVSHIPAIEAQEIFDSMVYGMNTNLTNPFPGYGFPIGSDMNEFDSDMSLYDPLPTWPGETSNQQLPPWDGLHIQQNITLAATVMADQTQNPDISPYLDGRDEHDQYEEKQIVLVHHVLESGPVKRKMDEFMTTFQAGQAKNTPERLRKRYSAEGKKKVAQVRKTSACYYCRTKKVECSSTQVCERCLKMASDPEMGDSICIRRKLEDNYIGVRDTHKRLFDADAKIRFFVNSVTGTPIKIRLYTECLTDRVLTSVALEVEVKKSKSTELCRWKRLGKANGIYVTQESMHADRYVITRESLPSVQRLDAFGRKNLLSSTESHSGRITVLLDSFLSLYSDQNRQSPMGKFCSTTLSITSLNGLVAYAFLDLQDGSYDLLETVVSSTHFPNQRFISETIHDQIRLQAAEGLFEAEKLCISKLDNLRQLIGSSKHNRIIAGICVLRLMLLYREKMMRDHKRLELPRKGTRNTDHQTRLENSEFMYKRFTVVYSTLCQRLDSPLATTWVAQTGDGSEDNERLCSAFAQLKAVYTAFCEMYVTDYHDAVFVALLLDRVTKVSSGPNKRRAVSKRE